MSEQTETPGKKSPMIPILIGAGVLIVGLLVAVGVLFFQNQDLREKNDVNELTITDMTTELEDLETDLQDMNEEIEDQDMEIDEKNQLLAEKEEELIKKQEKIDRLLAQNRISKKQAEEMRAKVEQLEYYIKKYQKRVAELEQVNDSLKTVILAQGEQMEGMRDENREMETRVIQAEIVAEMGKELDAVEFKFARVKKSGKKVVDDKYNGRRLDNLEICFKVLGNPVADEGLKDMYIVIYDPSGKPYTDGGAGQSGTFTYEAREKQYTLMKGVNYEKTDKVICVNYYKPESSEYVDGKNRVAVYCEGYEIGSGDFIVK